MELTDTEKRLISNRIAKAKDEATADWRSLLENIKRKAAGTWGSGSQFSAAYVEPTIEASKKFLENCRNILLDVLAPENSRVSDDVFTYISAELEERLQAESKWVTEWVRDSARQTMRNAPSSDAAIKRKFDEIGSGLKRDLLIEKDKRATSQHTFRADPLRDIASALRKRDLRETLGIAARGLNKSREPHKKVEPPSFDFIVTKELIPILQRDYVEIVRCMDSECWKAVIILCGSCIEGILYDLLKQNEENARKSKKAQKEREKKEGGKREVLPLEKWELNFLIEVALDLSLINKEIKNLHDIAREYRNLIHPAKEISGSRKIGKPEADIFFGVVNMLIRDLNDKGGKHDEV